MAAWPALKVRAQDDPCKYFYDTAGFELFSRQISALPEYYLTCTELSLLSRHAEDIAALIGPDAEIVEFGAGRATKICILLASSRPPARLYAGGHLGCLYQERSPPN
mgnify:CR=1 FL=1